jgi:hypothetical protein
MAMALEAFNIFDTRGFSRKDAKSQSQITCQPGRTPGFHLELEIGNPARAIYPAPVNILEELQ